MLHLRRDMTLTRFRQVVDAHLAPLGSLYRSLRDALYYNRSRKTRFGFMLAGDSRMTADDWEPEEIKLFLDLLPEHDAVVDVGANIGLYTCLAASNGKFTVAVEPSPRNVRYLLRNLVENSLKDVLVYPMGLADTSGVKVLYGYGGMASFVNGWGHSERGEPVSTTTLDELLGSRFHGERLLVKVDVEGYESDVLRGATATLKREPRPTWLVEILQSDPFIPGGENREFDATLKVFADAGYERRRIDRRSFVFHSSNLVSSSTLT